MKSAGAIFLTLITVSFATGFDKGSVSVRKSFPAGYVDSPYVIPDGSALYFIHSVASTFDLLTRDPYPDKVADYLPGHLGEYTATGFHDFHPEFHR